MSFIAVGIGNTSVQIGIFGDDSAPESRLRIPVPTNHLTFPVAAGEWAGPVGLSKANPKELSKDTPWYIASVNRPTATEIITWLGETHPDAKVHLLKNSQFPIEILTDLPEKVGTDRIAAATAVRKLKQDGNCAIFADAGTAITVNAINAEGKFLGGAILPGTTTASRALNKSTDQLPEVLVRADQPQPASIGSDTHPAIASGVYWGAIGAVRELMGRMTTELTDSKTPPDLYVTGGFGPALAEHLNLNATYIPHLVLSGIALAADNA